MEGLGIALWQEFTFSVAFSRKCDSVYKKPAVLSLFSALLQECHIGPLGPEMTCEDAGVVSLKSDGLVTSPSTSRCRVWETMLTSVTAE